MDCNSFNLINFKKETQTLNNKIKETWDKTISAKNCYNKYGKRKRAFSDIYVINNIRKWASYCKRTAQATITETGWLLIELAIRKVLQIIAYKILCQTTIDCYPKPKKLAILVILLLLVVFIKSKFTKNNNLWYLLPCAMEISKKNCKFIFTATEIWISIERMKNSSIGKDIIRANHSSKDRKTEKSNIRASLQEQDPPKY